ncbi:MAG: hypothetical protein AAF533_06185 [Acidobacteriota bacterium]
MTTRTKRALLVTAASVVLVLVAVMLLQRQAQVTTGQPFDSATWIATGMDRTATRRLEMVDELLASGVLKGKTRDEVTALLGPPEPKSYFKGSGFDTMHHLGKEGLFPSPKFLALSFESDVLVEAQVMVD